MGERKFAGARGVLGVVLLVALLAGCASSAGHQGQATAGATPAGAPTVHFRAYAGDGSLLVRSARHVVRGQCWTTSIAAPDSAAYRCFEGNKILDPCFAPAHPTDPPLLACLDSPWSKALMLHVRGKLPAPADGSAPSRPWAIQLDNGVRCVASTGTVPAVDGVNLTYRCVDGGNAALGDGGASEPTARYVAPHTTTLATVTVTTVWNA